MRSSLKCFWSFCHCAGYVGVNPGRMIRRARCAPPRPKALSESDADRLVAALAQARTPAERRDRCLFTVLLRAGLRIGSALALDVADVDIAAGELRLRVLKNGGTDTAYLAPEVVALLREHLAGRVDGALFQNRQGGRVGARQAARRLEIVARKAGVSGRISPHTLRHTLATRIFRATSNLLLVSRVLNHRSIASTQVYLQPDPAAVRAAIGYG